MKTRRNFLLGSAALVGVLSAGLTIAPAKVAVRVYKTKWRTKCIHHKGDGSEIVYAFNDMTGKWTKISYIPAPKAT